MAVEVFSVPVFLVVFRETLEAAIIISVLLAFLKQTLEGPNENGTAYKSLVRQVWVGTALGFLVCLAVGGAVIGTFYRVGKNIWDTTEYYYEGAFYLVASIIITFVGAALLRIGKMQEKWRVKIAEALQVPVTRGSRRDLFKRLAGKYAIFALAFITVSREGIEGIVFIAGVSFSAPATAVPLPVVVGLMVGCIIGWVLYRSGSSARLQLFLIASTCLLYLVAAGLFARSVWYFEQGQWNRKVGKDVSELGAGPGSYDINRSVWHVNCCSPEVNGGGGWGIFNGILGWTNSATYSTVISYNLYWLFVITVFQAMRYRETKGSWPFMNMKKGIKSDSGESIGVTDGEIDIHRRQVEERDGSRGEINRPYGLDSG